MSLFYRILSWNDRIYEAMIVYFTCDPINDVSLYVSNICMFPNESDVFNMQIMFPNAFLCFQYPIFVSNIQSMFPNANDVSKRQCFQCMFPIYIEPYWRVWRTKLKSNLKYLIRFWEVSASFDPDFAKNYNLSSKKWLFGIKLNVLNTWEYIVKSEKWVDCCED